MGHPHAVGGQAEVVLGKRVPIQLMAYEYSEFQGFWPLGEKQPYEKYTVFALHSGYYLKGRWAKLGVLSGLAYVDGTMRGDFLREEVRDPDCSFLCGDLDRYYEPVRVESPFLPLRIVAGINGRHVGLTFGPQVLFGRERTLVQYLAGLELGIL